MMPKTDPDVKYILTLTPDQAHTVSRACEFYSRIRMGQLKEIIWETITMPGEDYCERRDRIKPLLEEVRRIAFPELPIEGQSWGAGHDEIADESWNIYQAVRYKLAWTEHPEGGVTVNFSRPMDITGVGMPKCEVCGEG